jgi:hypothetical protein
MFDYLRLGVDFVARSFLFSEYTNIQLKGLLGGNS